jgi:hypothetical protein
MTRATPSGRPIETDPLPPIAETILHFAQDFACGLSPYRAREKPCTVELLANVRILDATEANRISAVNHGD